MSGLYIAAAHKSSGKTTLTVGMAAALARRGHEVQTFKKGPDYIDPMWLSRASGRPCYNLDFNTQTHEEIQALWRRKAPGADLALVEGNKGLFDGLDLEGADSNAALAALLDLPVVLVLDVSGITRGVAPLVLGYQAFAPELKIVGLILNKVSGARHEAKLRAVLERYTDVPVLGAVPREAGLLAPERHLGLIPPGESPEAADRITHLADVVDEHIDLSRLLVPGKKKASATEGVVTCQQTKVGDRGNALGKVDPIPLSPSPHGKRRPLRIGIARDTAFGFYYADDLETFLRFGAELIPLDMLKDAHLPDVDGLFLGGGFPETHMDALADNVSLREDIARAASQGLPIHAECGGLIYLSRAIYWGARYAPMVGVIPGDIEIHERPQGRGLMRLRETGAAPWSATGNRKSPAVHEAHEADIFPAHEFHYAAFRSLDADGITFAYEVVRGAGIDGRHDGIVMGNVLAAFAHLRHTKRTPWINEFLNHVAQTAGRYS